MLDGYAEPVTNAAENKKTVQLIVPKVSQQYCVAGLGLIEFIAVMKRIVCAATAQ